ncbi:MAG: FtsX-like permease family protein [Lachnospiraceae bacterium]|nr:FtsX-like permease family protein [Lachnospiraceae bacterium]
MIRFLFQKMLHKKWLVLSLFIGNILLIAIAASHPMYKDAAIKRMFADDFEQYMVEENKHPALMSVFYARRTQGNQEVVDSIQKRLDEWPDKIGIPYEYNIAFRYQMQQTAVLVKPRSTSPGSLNLCLSDMTDFADHIKIISGRMYEPGIDDRTIEAVVSESTFIKNDLVLNDVLEFRYIVNGNGETIYVKIVGVFRNDKEEDAYWVQSPNKLTDNLFVSTDVFEALYESDWNYKAVVRCYWYLMLDTDMMNPDNSDLLCKETQTLIDEFTEEKLTVTSPPYMDLLSDLVTKVNKVSVTLLILQVPVLVLLCAFLFMISSQMLSLEQNEISMFKSRGAGGFQIFLLYFLQSIFIALVSGVIGIFLGRFMCKALGSSVAFLEFVSRRSLEIRITSEVFVYVGIACAISILMTVLPVISYSRVSIVSLKRNRARVKKQFWQRFYLDFLLLGIGIYGLYNFNNQKDELVRKVLNGGSLDPMLYFSSSIFILGAGLVALRIQPLIVKLLFKVGKKIWSPQTYASLLQIIRTSAKQYFIMCFLILTVSLGIFNATVARTILSNAENNTIYQIGPDVVLKERWKDNSDMVRGNAESAYIYYEPSRARFDDIQGVEKLTYVQRETIEVNNQITSDFMGIDSKAFGETVSMKDDLLPTHFYNYLNALASDANAVLLSENFRDAYGIKIGDKVELKVVGQTYTGTVYGFFDYWPTYSASVMEKQANGTMVSVDKYMVVANLASVQFAWGTRPYEVWMKMQDSADSVYDFIETNSINLEKFEDRFEEIRKIRNQTLFQGTNGTLTMSFIIILVLCGAGFLIYWILSIRSRELLFGVFRAMGMSKGAILHMLVNEQIFSSCLSIGLGALIGVIASRNFVPLIQIAYSADKQSLPLELITETNDMVRLFAIIGIVFVVCMAILTRIVLSMKITNALKLGED